MSRHIRVMSGVVSLLALTACITTGPFSDERPVARSADASDGVLQRMTDADVNMANVALDSALESRISGASVGWRNPESGNHGQVTPLSTFRSSDGSFCRRYKEELVVTGHRVRYEDIACRRARRHWVPVGS